MRLAVGIASAVAFLALSILALLTGGSWDRVEGVVGIHQLAVARGELHAPPTGVSDPARIPLYGSLWYRMAGMSDDPSLNLALGRILSIGSSVALAYLGFRILRRRFGVDSTGAALGGTVWLGWMPALQFGGVDRCDAPALLLAATGWSLQLGGSTARTVAGGLLAGFSSSLRATSGPEAIAWGIVSLLAQGRARKDLGWWVASGLLGGIAALGVAWYLDGEAAIRHILSAGGSSLSAAQAVDLLLRVAPASMLVLAVAALAGAPRPLAWSTTVALLLSAFLLSRTGANINWLLGPTWFLGLVLGAGSARFSPPILLACFFQTAFVELPRVRDLAARSISMPERVALVRGLDRPVLTSDALPVLLAGGHPAIDDPHLVEDFSSSGRLPEGYLAHRARSSRWAILTDPELVSGGTSRWTRETFLWVRDSTKICASGGGAQLRLPREAACPGSR